MIFDFGFSRGKCELLGFSPGDIEDLVDYCAADDDPRLMDIYVRDLRVYLIECVFGPYLRPSDCLDLCTWFNNQDDSYDAWVDRSLRCRQPLKGGDGGY